MSLWVVAGGQFGGEGKGKVSAFLTQREEIDVCIRCGGPNSGHSFLNDAGDRILLRQLPTGYIRPQARLLLPAGALIDLEVLRYEIEKFQIDSQRIGIDRNAMIIEQCDKDRERELNLRERLSSTLCGVGSAVSRRVLRAADVRTAEIAAKDVPWLSGLVTDVSREANLALDRGKKVLVEGTQGFGLSVYHSDNFPKATSRDTTAAAFLSEVGLSPMMVKEIVLVFRTFPIRVAGAQAGPLFDEISWERLQEESGYPYPISEMTTVSKRVRRVGRFDWTLARRALEANRPTQVAITGFDYLDYSNLSLPSIAALSTRSQAFLRQFESEFNVPVSLCGTGPALSDVASACEASAGISEVQNAEILR